MNRELIQNHMAIVIQIVRCIHLKKVLSTVDPNPDLNFWCLMHGGMLDLAVLEWCKIFGADSENTHWKVIVEEQSQNHFRESLFKYLDVTAIEWNDYWVDLKTYRDELVAHHKKDSDVSTYPELDLALKSSCFYYNHLAEFLNEDDSDPIPKLEPYCERFHAQSLKIARDAVDATKKHRENVY